MEQLAGGVYTYLADLIQHVPDLVDCLHPGSIRALLSCGKDTRNVLSGRVAKIKVLLDKPDLRHGTALQTIKLLCRAWPQTLRQGSDHLGLRTVYELIRAPWPELTSLALSRLNKQALHLLISAKWSSLSTLHISDTVLTPEAVKTLCKAP